MLTFHKRIVIKFCFRTILTNRKIDAHTSKKKKINLIKCLSYSLRVLLKVEAYTHIKDTKEITFL